MGVEMMKPKITNTEKKYMEDLVKILENEENLWINSDWLDYGQIHFDGYITINTIRNIMKLKVLKE